MSVTQGLGCYGNSLIHCYMAKKFEFVQMHSQLNGSVKEPNISIHFFFPPSLNGVLFPMFCLLVEGKCQILVFF